MNNRHIQEFFVWLLVTFSCKTAEHILSWISKFRKITITMNDSPGTPLRETLNKRFKVLESIDEAPQRKPELVKKVDSSRSTIDRAVSDLIEQKCVEYVDGMYQTTPLGKTSLNIHPLDSPWWN